VVHDAIHSKANLLFWRCSLITKIQPVQAIERAFAILEAFSYKNGELGITEISRMINLPKPTVSRLVATMEGLGYLRQNEDTKKYLLGSKILSIGNIAKTSYNIVEISTTVLKKLRNEIRETVFINVIDGNERVCIDSFPGLNAARIAVEIGQRSPLYAGADSRMLLASLSDNDLEEYLKNTHFRCFTPNTITDPEELRRKIIEDRERGFSFSSGECHQGSVCVTAPIKDVEGKIVASLSIAFPELKGASIKSIEAYKIAVINAALEISQLT
jgi:DNA-binding IclR family transcriptional regulator